MTDFAALWELLTGKPIDPPSDGDLALQQWQEEQEALRQAKARKDTRSIHDREARVRDAMTARLRAEA